MNQEWQESGEEQRRLIREHIAYDPATGIFTRAKKTGKKGIVGAPVGTLNKKDGYRRIQVWGRAYLASHVAFVIMLDRFPEHEVDHKNRQPSDDRWYNLREATSSQNKQNRIGYPGRRISRFKGVSKNHNRWAARVGHKYLGTFDTEEEAAAVFKAAAIKEFGEFARW